MLELFIILLLWTQIEVETPKEIFPENIEYCQYVYFSWQNPLNEICNFDQVERSLKIDFKTYYENDL